MQTIPSVAICIPTFNQAQYLPEAVRSACHQTYPGVEVWVSDDASTDNTSEVMTQLCEKFPQIRYHRHLQNLGMVANNSWVMSQPSTDFIVHLDSDDILQPVYVNHLVTLLQQYPSAGYAHSAVQEIDEQGCNRGVRQLARQDEFREADRELLAAAVGYRMAANISVFRSQALRELRFYEGRPDFTHDYDLIVRMADAGYGNVYTSEVLAAYRVWADVKTIRPKRKSLELRGMIRVYEESLVPAFQKRRWNPQLIKRERCRLALIHAPFCFRPLFSEPERAELIALLKELGDSPALRLRFFLLRLGLGPFLEWQYIAERKLKGFVKEILARLRETPKRDRVEEPIILQ